MTLVINVRNALLYVLDIIRLVVDILQAGIFAGTTSQRTLDAMGIASWFELLGKN